MVGTTLIFSAAVITVLGFFLLQQIAGGLLQNKERSAATLARWKVTMSGRFTSAAMWPSTIQNMKRYAVGLDSVV